MKKIICAVLAVCTFSSLFAIDMPFFSGYAGILAKISNDTSNSTTSDDEIAFDPQITTEDFFSGQLDFGGVLLVRGEFALTTADICEKGIFEDTDATFRVNELSTTLRIGSVNASHFFSLFLGNYESIGSDMFLQRQFGIKPITSPITENWSGLCGSTLYPFYGAGGSYSIHFEQPLAIGLYAFVNNDDDTDETVFNADIRFACVLRSFALDFSAGLAFPKEETISETGEKVILLIRTETLHAGFNMLIGNRYAFSIFTQAGFSDLDLNPEESDSLSIDANNMYLFFEPRIALRQCNINLALFSIPQDTVDDMLYLHDPLGVNLTVYTDHLYIENINFTFGIHTTFSFPDKTFMDIVDDYAEILSWDRDLYVTPYVSMPLFGGSLKGSVTVNTLSLGSADWLSAINGSVGYKTQL